MLVRIRSPPIRQHRNTRTPVSKDLNLGYFSLGVLPSLINSQSQIPRQTSQVKKSVNCKNAGHLLHQCPLGKRKEGESKPRPSAKEVFVEHTPERHEGNIPSGRHSYY